MSAVSDSWAVIICHLNIGSSGIPFLLLCYLILWNIAKDRKVIPDPIDDRKFQEWKESGNQGTAKQIIIYQAIRILTMTLQERKKKKLISTGNEK